MGKTKSTEYIGAFWFGAADEAQTRIHTPTSDFMKVEEVSVLRIKEKHRITSVSFDLERLTRLELATSTLARWRSTR